MSSKNPFINCYIALSGNFASFSHKEIENHLLFLGAKITKQITKRTTHLIATENSKNKPSYKVKEAQRLQIPILDISCLAAYNNIFPLPFINRLPSEILVNIFSYFERSSEIFSIILTCKRWACTSIEILWRWPQCTNWESFISICHTLVSEEPYFDYRSFIRHLNLAKVANKAQDIDISSLAVCSRLEKLSLPGCRGLTDVSIIPLVQNKHKILEIDISGLNISEMSINAIAENCPNLRALRISGCLEIVPESLTKLAETCNFITKLNLDGCYHMTTETVLAFARSCPRLSIMSLKQCRLIRGTVVKALLNRCHFLWALDLAECELVDDNSFSSLPSGKTYDALRYLDLTCCSKLTDSAVEKIISVAPRLQILRLVKCFNLTDISVRAISRLRKHLRTISLASCWQITDKAIIRLAQNCIRIKAINLNKCTLLTDTSVTRIAELLSLREIQLSMCDKITDKSIIALTRIQSRRLNKLCLDFCSNLSRKFFVDLLTTCPDLSFLSLTAVPAFLGEDLKVFSQVAPPEYPQRWRQDYRMFSGLGLMQLRQYLQHATRLDGSQAEGTPIDINFDS